MFIYYSHMSGAPRWVRLTSEWLLREERDTITTHVFMMHTQICIWVCPSYNCVLFLIQVILMSAPCMCWHVLCRASLRHRNHRVWEHRDTNPRYEKTGAPNPGMRRQGHQHLVCEDFIHTHRQTICRRNTRQSAGQHLQEMRRQSSHMGWLRLVGSFKV